MWQVLAAAFCKLAEQLLLSESHHSSLPQPNNPLLHLLLKSPKQTPLQDAGPCKTPAME